eukprot:Sdes_comp19765_c0_seq1m11814
MSSEEETIAIQGLAEELEQELFQLHYGPQSISVNLNHSNPENSTLMPAQNPPFFSDDSNSSLYPAEGLLPLQSLSLKGNPLPEPSLSNFISMETLANGNFEENLQDSPFSAPHPFPQNHDAIPPIQRTPASMNPKDFTASVVAQLQNKLEAAAQKQIDLKNPKSEKQKKRASANPKNPRRFRDKILLQMERQTALEEIVLSEVQSAPFPLPSASSTSTTQTSSPLPEFTLPQFNYDQPLHHANPLPASFPAGNPVNPNYLLLSSKTPLNSGGRARSLSPRPATLKKSPIHSSMKRKLLSWNQKTKICPHATKDDLDFKHASLKPAYQSLKTSFSFSHLPLNPAPAPDFDFHNSFSPTWPPLIPASSSPSNPLFEPAFLAPPPHQLPASFSYPENIFYLDSSPPPSSSSSLHLSLPFQ